MGNAVDYGLIIKLLVNDNDLKTLMDIPISDKTNYAILLDKYFLQTYVSDKFTDDGVCRLLIRSGMQNDTNNDYVKWNSLIIEVYVPRSKDSMANFETRTNQISDRLIKILNRITISDNRICFVNSYEMVSGTTNFKRQSVKFEYKKIYS